MSVAVVTEEMPLAPIISSLPGGDHHSHHHQPASAPSTVESYGNENQAETATVPRALALDDDDTLSFSSAHSSRVTGMGSITSTITLTTPTAPAGSSGAMPQTPAIRSAGRPTGRVLLQALETSPGGAPKSVHLGGAAGGDVVSNFDNESNSRLLLSPSRVLPTKAAEEASGPFEAEPQPSLHDVAGTYGSRTAVNNKTDSNKSEGDRSENDGESSPGNLLLPAPLALSVASGNCGAAADSAEVLSDSSTKPRSSMTGAGGLPTILHSPSGDAKPARRNLSMLGAIPSFFQRAGSKVSSWGGSDTREQSSKKWSMLYSTRSGKTADYEDEPLGLDGYDIERARRNWRVLRAVFMALGKAIQV